jgi:hypothetical protein
VTRWTAYASNGRQTYRSRFAPLALSRAVRARSLLLRVARDRAAWRSQHVDRSDHRCMAATKARRQQGWSHAIPTPRQDQHPCALPNHQSQLRSRPGHIRPHHRDGSDRNARFMGPPEKSHSIQIWMIHPSLTSGRGAGVCCPTCTAIASGSQARFRSVVAETPLGPLTLRTLHKGHRLHPWRLVLRRHQGSS